MYQKFSKFSPGLSQKLHFCDSKNWDQILTHGLIDENTGLKMGENIQFQANLGLLSIIKCISTISAKLTEISSISVILCAKLENFTLDYVYTRNYLAHGLNTESISYF